ncbi:UNVERIFIED_ORG: histidine kinase/DNA gyrase B/HSP90-like ATPase [Bacillus cereus]
MWKQAIGWLLITVMIFLMIHINFRDSDTNLIQKRAQNGTIDLRDLPSNAKILSLAGEWKFTPNKFVDVNQFQEQAPNQLVPGQWESKAQYGSYQLKIELPKHFSEVGFRIRNIWSAHTIYVNGEKGSEIGQIGKSKEATKPENPSYEMYLKPKTKELLITIHVSNFYNVRGGIIFPIDFGDAKAMQEDVAEDTNIEWTAVSILLIFSIFHLTIFLLRKKDDGFFYSGCYFLSLALIVMTRGERILLRAVPNIPFEFYFRLQDSITFFSAILLPLFISKTMPTIINKKQLLLLFSPFFIYSVGIILFPARALSNLQTPFFFYMNIMLLWIILRMTQLIIQKKWLISKNEILIFTLMLLTLFMFLFSGTLEQLFASGRNIFNRFGLLGFIIMMNVFLGTRFINRTEEAEHLSKKLEAIHLTKDSFLKVTTQELKDPLYHAINLIKSVKANDKKEKHSNELHVLEQLTERLLYLTNDLQDFTKIKFHDYSFTAKSTNIKMVVNHVYKLMELPLSRKHITYQEYVPNNLHGLVDEDRLTQVLYRILEECCYYAVDGKIVIDAQHIGENIHLTFKATSNSTVTYEDTRTEIGLLISKELLERMDGHLQVDYYKTSILFKIQVPFYEYKEIHTILQEQHNFKEVSQANTSMLPTILIVDDDVIHTEVLKSLLAETYNITIVHSAQDAIFLLESTKDFELLIIDETLPEIGGVELAKHIRKKTSVLELPILMLSSKDYPTNVDHLFASGITDYLVKPCTKQVLLARLHTIFQTKEAILKAFENEMAFLQAQIKPHFLYNAMSNIISFCYTDSERAAHLLTMLSSYLRYIFESGNETNYSTLQKEVSIIQAYVEIEKARFGERLSFSYEVDTIESLDEIYIPNLLVQPLVENAIRHGLFEKEGNGHVQINIKQIKEILFIQVIDNGIGMSETTIHNLLNGTLQNQGIGFSNVLRRVRKFSNGTIEIYSIENKGTTINVTIPLKERM